MWRTDTNDYDQEEHKEIYIEQKRKVQEIIKQEITKIRRKVYKSNQRSKRL